MSLSLPLLTLILDLGAKGLTQEVQFISRGEGTLTTDGETRIAMQFGKDRKAKSSVNEQEQ